MEIKTIKVGYLETNCYILSKDNEVIIIDPGAEEDKIIDNINGEVIGIIVTHYHHDHIGALDILSKKYKVFVYDIFNLSEGINKIGNFSFEVIKTPGHKDDLISIYFKSDKAMFVGDFIFEDNIGRCDLEGGNFDEMLNSIDKIKAYDDDITIYSGHGSKTNLGYEKKCNYYFNQERKTR